MKANSQSSPEIQVTEHPHVVRVAEVCGGSPIIKGSRIPVRHIAELYKRGETVDEIVEAHPQLSAAAVYDAISYYLDHQAEIEQEIAAGRLESLMERHHFTVDERGFAHFGNDRNSS
ncbi:MAG TPA: DUF433 domain-containing protein [Caldilineaceae bacterium]|nr:DUF433 domain-containing protein [Caldilineaceae bacterium]